LARSRIHHISKETFLPAFKATFDKIFTPENACAGFRGAGLVPHDPEVVLSKLDVQLRTPTPPTPGTVAWEAQTPRNAREIEAQSTLVRNRMRIHRGSPASSLDEQIKQLSKGAQQVAHNTEAHQPTLRPAQRSAPPPKQHLKNEAIELRTIAITAIFFSVEFNRPIYVYIAIYIWLGP
jgi:hypothetical protein